VTLVKQRQFLQVASWTFLSSKCFAGVCIFQQTKSSVGQFLQSLSDFAVYTQISNFLALLIQLCLSHFAQSFRMKENVRKHEKVKSCGSLINFHLIGDHFLQIYIEQTRCAAFTTDLSNFSALKTLLRKL